MGLWGRKRPGQHGTTCFWQRRQQFEAHIALGGEEAAVCVEDPLGEGKVWFFPSSSPMIAAEQRFFLLALSIFFLLPGDLLVFRPIRLILCILPGCDLLKIRTATWVVTTHPSCPLIPPTGLLQTNMGLNPLHTKLLKDSDPVAASTTLPMHSPFLGALKAAG